VPQQRLVATLKRRSIAAGWHGRRQGIGAMQLWDAAQLGQGVLQAVTEALEALGEADRAALPVGVGQDEVVDQMLEQLAGDGHVQTRHVREVGSTQTTRLVDLREEDLLGRSVQGTPLLDVSLQGA
jgi:hypothetical protein